MAAAPAVAAPANAAPGPLGEALSSTDSAATFESLLGRLGVNVAEIQPLRPPAGVPAQSSVSERAGGFSPPPKDNFKRAGNTAFPATQSGANALRRRTFGGTSVSGGLGSTRITFNPGSGQDTDFRQAPLRQSPITQKPALQPPPVPRIVNQTLPRDQNRRDLASGGAGPETSQLRRLI